MSLTFWLRNMRHLRRSNMNSPVHYPPHFTYSTTTCLLAERPNRVGKYINLALAGSMV